jgi:hypothetical protein
MFVQMRSRATDYRGSSRPLRAALATALEREALFVFAVAACGALLLVRVPTHVAQDAWLALVSGRDVAEHGLPAHDHLAVLTFGARWIDQQWLAQLAMYKLERLGGLALMTIACTVATLTGLAITLVAARRLGAGERQLTRVLPLPAFLFIIVATEIRTQDFAFPLFAAVLALLTLDARRPRRITYLVFALLVIWGNLHGSVVVGVALTSLYGLVTIVEHWRRSGRPGWPPARALAFVFGAPVCLLASPYGLAGPDYYRGTIFNSRFRSVVTEWRPVTSVALFAVPFFLLAFAAVWQAGRNPQRGTAFDRVALAVTIAAGIASIRNVVWFALALLMLLPGILAPGMAPPAPRRAKLNLAIVGLGLAAVAGACAFVATRPEKWFEGGYDRHVVPLVASVAATHPSARVFADIHFADWLLWKDPQLANRVAYDARLELLTPRQLTAVSHLGNVQYDYAALTRGYSVLVLDPLNEQQSTRLLLRRAGTRVLLRSGTTVVAEQGLDP